MRMLTILIVLVVISLAYAKKKKMKAYEVEADEEEIERTKTETITVLVPTKSSSEPVSKEPERATTGLDRGKGHADVKKPERGLESATAGLTVSKGNTEVQKPERVRESATTLVIGEGATEVKKPERVRESTTTLVIGEGATEVKKPERVLESATTGLNVGKGDMEIQKPERVLESSTTGLNISKINTEVQKPERVRESTTTGLVTGIGATEVKKPEQVLESATTGLVIGKGDAEGKNPEHVLESANTTEKQEDLGRINATEKAQTSPEIITTTNMPQHFSERTTTTDELESEMKRAEAIVDRNMGKSRNNLNDIAPPKYGFQVGLFINGGSTFCGGALLNKDWVITAASCVPPQSNVIAAVGLQYKYLNDTSKYHDQVHIVQTQTVHGAYNAKNHQNDIALLKLTKSAQIDDEYITTIRLPKLSQEHLDMTNHKAILLGFGKDSKDSSKVSPHLREGRSPIVPKSYCQVRYLFLSTIYDTNLCLSGLQAKGFCKGDTGGPLIYYENDQKPTLIGINSYVGGLGCSLSWPIVLTRVSAYLRWINLITGIEMLA